MLKFHHIGILCKNIEKSIEEFLSLGFSIERDVVYDQYRLIKIVFLNSDGLRIELIQPDKESEIYPLMKRYKNLPYHFCYATDDMNQSIQKLIKNGYIMTQERLPAPAIDNQDVCFLMKNPMGLIELLEEK